MKNLYRLLGILLTIGVYFSCAKPEENEQATEQMVLTGLYYLDNQPIAITIEDGLIKDIFKRCSGRILNPFNRTGSDRSSGEWILIPLFCRGQPYQ